MTQEEEVALTANMELTHEEEVARTANMELTREEEVALYGEHKRLKAFYPTAVERLYFNVVCAYQACSACSSFSFSTSASDKFVSSAITSRE